MGMSTRFAFVGFRHSHIRSLLNLCRARDDITIVGCCEEDAATRSSLAAESDVEITHSDLRRMLDDVECDVVAVGDCFGRHAQRLLVALERGLHAISDKPLCTSLDDLTRIEELALKRSRVVGCIFDLRDAAPFVKSRELLLAGEIGEVQAIHFDGQHPLLLGKRPEWYFEAGLHGGTLNDIAVHAVDLIPWVTQLRFQAIVAARCWNARPPQALHFKECAQAMLTLENGAGVIGDVSYLIPDSFGYDFANYWRFTFWGTEGVLSAAYNSPTIVLHRNGETEPKSIATGRGLPGGYLDSFLREVRGQTDGLHLPSADVLHSSRISLLLQRAADSRSDDHPLY